MIYNLRRLLVKDKFLKFKNFYLRNFMNDKNDPEYLEMVQKYKDKSLNEKIQYFIDSCKISAKKLYKKDPDSKNFTEYFLLNGDRTILWEFNNKEDVYKWRITCDSKKNRGNSKANIIATESGRLLFQGNLVCEDYLKDGSTYKSGWAHFCSPRNIGFLNKFAFWDWSSFTHLIIRYKGDGRMYLILLKTPDKFIETKSHSSVFPLYTTGGPYWFTAKIPFSKFAYVHGSQLQDEVATPILHKINSLGFTLNDNISGPFKLEISHIGLEIDKTEKELTIYEGYGSGSYY